MKNEVSLGELARELGINKSRLAYYHFIGLLMPIMKVGKMGIFDKKRTLAILKKIEQEKKGGKKLNEIKDKLINLKKFN